MRGLEIGLLLICMVIALPLVAVLMPVYNNGSGIDTGANDLSGVNAFNWSKAQEAKPTKENTNIISQANYYFQLGVTAITGIGTILFGAPDLAPSLINIFFINPVLGGVLLSLLAILALITWYQITKGDDWSGRR